MAIVAIPERLCHLPVDDHGRAIPWMAPVHDGKPSFGRNHDHLRRKAIKDGLCGQCGHVLDYWKFFIVDEDVHDGLGLFEPAMHEDCARYALTICPFLRHPSYTIRAENHVSYVDIDNRVVVYDLTDQQVGRPERMHLVKTRNYKAHTYPDGVLVARVANPIVVEQF